MLLISRYPNPAVAARWRYYAACMALLALVAPYGILAISPNDRIIEIGAEIQDKVQERARRSCGP
jgi:hypothetical protein